MNKSRIERRRVLSSQTQIRISLAFIVLVAGFFSFVVWPILPSQFPLSSFFNKYFPHLGLDLLGGTHLVYEADLSSIPPLEKNSALEGTRDVIERRVNILGVSEPVVQTARQSGKSRLIVELAGVLDVNQAIKIIGETPLLEFKETGAVATSTSPTDQQLSEVEKKNQEKEALAKELIKRIQAGEKFEDLAKQYSEDPGSKDQGGDLDFVSRGVFTPSFETAIFDEMRVGELRNTPLKTEFGYHVIRKIEERSNEKGELEVHSAHILLRSESVTPESQVNWVHTALSGKNLKQARVTFDPQTNLPQISLLFDSDGSKLFEEITKRNVDKPVGIFLDGTVISAPVVQSVISGGQAVITGNFGLPEAKLLAQRLNAGALPVPITLISQQTVGPTLGKDSLEKSLFAGLVGFILVVIFMVGYYRLPGLISVLALAIYAIIAQGLFEIIPVILTVAGIAGFILSIGMAVDANILIIERLKEELRKGDSLSSAVESGFSRAWLSIRDSNASSLITCAILYWFGTSIIRGFAVTLALGILVSLFSAITITRTLLRILIRIKFLQKGWLFGVRHHNA